MKIKTWTLRNEAGDSGDAGGGAAVVADPAAGAPADASLLATAAAAPAPINEAIPEKYRVTKEDGTFDLEASARKLADGQANLEKRLGSGDVAPKSPAEYALELPDGLDFAALKDDPDMQALLKSGHEAGLNNKQMSWAVNQMIQAVQGNAAEMAEKSTATLREVWKTDGEFKDGVDSAYKAAAAFLEPGELESFMKRGGPGDDATIIKLLAKVGKEMQEDKPASQANGNASGAETIRSLMASPAYMDSKHPDNAKVTAQVRAHYEKQYGMNPVT